MATLGVNIDHVATIRQARGTRYPDPVEAAVLAQLGGADQITVHLREDRRHIIDRDVRILKEILQVPLNLEMALHPEMVAIALTVRPHMCTLVPERREERTTEGGLNVGHQPDLLRSSISALKAAGIQVSLFIEPHEEDVKKSLEFGATMIELHTGRYADADTPDAEAHELVRIKTATESAQKKGLVVHAGHGLNYRNTRPVAQIPGMRDLNIGHSIIARAVLVGLERAVKEMKDLLR